MISGDIHRAYRERVR